MLGQCLDCIAPNYEAIGFAKAAITKSHRLRSDTVRRDARRVRTMRFDDLVAEAMNTGSSFREARAKVVESMKLLASDIVTGFAEGCPEGIKQILLKYKMIKLRAPELRQGMSDTGDEASEFVVRPLVSADRVIGPIDGCRSMQSLSSHRCSDPLWRRGGEAGGRWPSGRPAAGGPADCRRAGGWGRSAGNKVQPDAMTKLNRANVHMAQLLHRVGPNTDRYFVCRADDCDSRGQFVSSNVHWASTQGAGGWQWACPNCGAIYQATKSKVVPHHVYVFRDTMSVCFSEWGETAEESVTAAYKEHMAKVTEEFNSWDSETISAKMNEIVANHRVPFEWEDFQMTERAKTQLTWVNSSRVKKLPFSWSHLPATFKATFIRFIPGETPVMTVEDAKRTVAMSLRLIGE